MNKRLITWIVAIIALGGAAAFWWSANREIAPDEKLRAAFTDKDFADYNAKYGRTNEVPTTVLVPLKLSERVRLAVGGLGLANNDQNQQLGDLVTAQLSDAPGLALVERQSLDAILRELNLNWSGFVRAKDAVRIGKLLKADWFLLGTEAKLNGTNALVIRVVDARTGIMHDAGVVAANQSPAKLAADVAAFVRESRQNAAQAITREYLAISAFEDLSVNNRLLDFQNQLSSYLLAAYQRGSVALLEREYVETLLQEVNLDLAGLTEENSTTPIPPMQSAFWLVTGQYQSYETTNHQVELNLEVRRIFGAAKQFKLRGLPGEPMGPKVKAAIDETTKQSAGSIMLTRSSEARVQFQIGLDLSEVNRDMGDTGLIFVLARDDWDMQRSARRRHKLEQAIKAFETVILLEPTNSSAKLYLAACLRHPMINNLEKARANYREVIERPLQDKWTRVAQKALVETFRLEETNEKLRGYESASFQTTNPAANRFYKDQAETARKESLTVNSAGDEAIQYAETNLLASIRMAKKLLMLKSGNIESSLGMEKFATTFGSNRRAAAEHLVKLLPQMKAEFPELTPYLLAAVVSIQPDTNSPVISEFKQVLDGCVAYPDQTLNIKAFWRHTSGLIYGYCVDTTNYSLAVALMEGKQQAASKGDAVEFDDQEKIELAYAYLAIERWQNALTIFEGFNSRPVRAASRGPWGEPFQQLLTDKLASYCREKLKLAPIRNQRDFSMGKPVLCLHTPSAVLADDTGLWVGIGGQLLRLDFDLKTNLVIKLPMDASVPITTLCPNASSIWVGTTGSGLIEFDKTSHECRHLTEADGLLMNYITSLKIFDGSLWIGYGDEAAGGLGQLNLDSRKIKAFMPSLNAGADPSQNLGESAPRQVIDGIAADTEGDLLCYTGHAIKRFNSRQGLWSSEPNPTGNAVTYFTADAARMILGVSIWQIQIEVESKSGQRTDTNQISKATLVIPRNELSRLQENYKTNGSNQRISAINYGGIPNKEALAIHTYRDDHWQILEDAEALSNPPTTMTLDGNNLWVGGEGFIALVDLQNFKVHKYCHIKAEEVNQIQIGGGYVWAQFDRHLYRAPLSALQ